MKKKLCLLMLMLLTGTQTVLHCADDGGDKKKLLLQDLKLEGDEIKLDEIHDIYCSRKKKWSLTYPLAFLGGACGVVIPVAAGRCLLNSEIYVSYLRWLASCLQEPIAQEIKEDILEAPVKLGVDVKENIAKWVVERRLARDLEMLRGLHDVSLFGAALVGACVGLCVGAVYGGDLGQMLDNAQKKAQEAACYRVVRTLNTLGVLYNQAVSSEGLLYSLPQNSDDTGRKMIVLDDLKQIKKDRNNLIRECYLDYLDYGDERTGLVCSSNGHSNMINIDQLMQEQRASVSGLFNKFLLGPDNLRRAGAAMAKIEKLDKALGESTVNVKRAKS